MKKKKVISYVLFIFFFCLALLILSDKHKVIIKKVSDFKRKMDEKRRVKIIKKRYEKYTKLSDLKGRDRAFGFLCSEILARFPVGTNFSEVVKILGENDYLDVRGGQKIIEYFDIEYGAEIVYDRKKRLLGFHFVTKNGIISDVYCLHHRGIPKLDRKGSMGE